MTEWHKIGSEPRDGNFRFYGLHVTNKRGFRWFEVWYVVMGEGGTLLDSSGDVFSTWSYDDFEVWADVPQPPTDGELGEKK